MVERHKNAKNRTGVKKDADTRCRHAGRPSHNLQDTEPQPQVQNHPPPPPTKQTRGERRRMRQKKVTLHALIHAVGFYHLPSEVLGTISPILSGLKCAGSMMWTPAAGITMFCASWSSIFLRPNNGQERRPGEGGAEATIPRVVATFLGWRHAAQPADQLLLKIKIQRRYTAVGASQTQRYHVHTSTQTTLC